MKLHEIPQDQDPTFEGGKKLCYALDGDGKFVPAVTSGWDVEAVVKDLAWQSIHLDLGKTRREVEAGRVSALAYFMKWRLMDLPLLAGNMGVSRWRVRWHMRPAVFARLSEAWMARYAECLAVSPEDLRQGRLPEIQP